MSEPRTTAPHPPPKEGDALLLDGFEYVLGTGKKQLHDDGRTVTVQTFKRPKPKDAAEHEAHKANFNYKAGGTLLAEELVWCDPKQLRADLKSQADQLIRGNRNVAGWAEGASAVQDEALEKRTTGAWTLPDRHVMKPPVQIREHEVAHPDGTKKVEHREAVIVPQRVDEARKTAQAVLAHAHPYDTRPKIPGPTGPGGVTRSASPAPGGPAHQGGGVRTTEGPSTTKGG